jgi:hypothetical protein
MHARQMHRRTYVDAICSAGDETIDTVMHVGATTPALMW